MRLAYTAEQSELQLELREYFGQIMSESEKLALRNGYSVPEATEAYRSVVAKLGRDGWLGIGWPVEMGGQGRTMVEQAIFNDEASRAGVPTPLLTINSVGPVIHAYGTDEQRNELVGGVLAGKVHFAIGYSESEAGTDLAGLRTSAVREGEEYVINGQKIWTGMMEAADYIWLAVRTDPEAAKHRGISILVVPRHAAGITSIRMRTMGEQSVATVNFDNVRVPLSACIGGENNGWKLITGQLNHERVALNSSARLEAIGAGLLSYAKSTTTADGTPLIDLEWVRRDLAVADAKAEYLKLLNRRLAGDVDRGALSPADASAAKVFGSEATIDINELSFEIVGAAGALQADQPGAVLGGQLERMYRAAHVQTFIGGTNEVQRDIIARLGLGLPRTRR